MKASIIGIILVMSCNSQPREQNAEGMAILDYHQGSKSGVSKEPVFAVNPAWVAENCKYCGLLVYRDLANGKVYHKNPVCPQFAKEQEKKRRGVTYS